MVYSHWRCGTATRPARCWPEHSTNASSPMSLRRKPAEKAPAAPMASAGTDLDDATGPMTDAQAARLKSLAEEAREPEAYDETLTRAEAAQRIDALAAMIGRERRGGIERRPRT